MQHQYNIHLPIIKKLDKITTRMEAQERQFQVTIFVLVGPTG